MSLIPTQTWRRNQLVMGLTVFVVFTGFAFVLPFLPLYVRELGVVEEDAVALWAGVLIGVSPLLAGLLAPVWGRLGDRFGHKRMAARALLSYVVLLLASATVTSVGQLLVLRIGIGLFGGIGPLALAMATTDVPREQTGRAVGGVQAAQILSAAVGPFVGGLLADLIGIRWTFVATAGLCAVALVLMVALYEESPRTPQAAPAAGAGAGRIALDRVLPVMAVLFLVNFVGRSFTPILPLYVHGLGVATDRLAFSTGLLISVYSVAAAVSATLMGRAATTRSPRRLLRASLVAGAATVFAMSLAPSFPVLLGFAVAVGLASGGALTLCYTIGGLRLGNAGRATAFGYFASAALFGGAVSPTVAGLLAHWDLLGIFYLDTAVYLGVAVGLTWLADTEPEPSGAPPAAARV